MKSVSTLRVLMKMSWKFQRLKSTQNPDGYPRGRRTEEQGEHPRPVDNLRSESLDRWHALDIDLSTVRVGHPLEQLFELEKRVQDPHDQPPVVFHSIVRHGVGYYLSSKNDTWPTTEV